MINRTKIKDSIYNILDEDPKKIQKYIDNEAKKTDKQKEKEKKKRNKRSNITDVNLQENIDSQDDNPYNKIVIHTEKDNLVHNYFHDFNMYWDAGDPMSSAILKLPKTDTENTKYWITYTGDVVIYLGNEINTEMQKSQDQKAQNTYWDLQGMKPIFKGEIGRIKEYDKELEIHVDSIGKRFKQKIPEDFRQSFIYNQNVRDAFQAICEFLGVKYICPPGALPEQDNQTEDTSASGDGTENNVNNATSQEQQLAQAVSQAASQAIQNTTKASQEQGKTSQNNANTNENNQNSDLTLQNNQAQNSLNESTQQNDVQNGFSDISFDANGNIVHSSTTIITSPDMEDTLLSLEQHPLDKYLEDTSYVSTDVKKFLNGEMFDTVHNSVLNYNAITIEPKSSSTSDISTINNANNNITNMDQNNDGSVSNDEAQQYGQSLTNKLAPGLGLQNVRFVQSNSQSQSSSSSSKSTQGKKKLSMAYIRTLSKSQAAELAKKTNEYDTNTIKALKRRSMGFYW